MLLYVWYKNLDRSFSRFVTMHAFDRGTDRRTDRILIARPRLHCMQRDKNVDVNVVVGCAIDNTYISLTV